MISLFWIVAYFDFLKQGNNNFGIVTTFTMKAIDVGNIWGGFQFYDQSLENDVLDAFYHYGETAGAGNDGNTAGELLIPFLHGVPLVLLT